MQAQRETVGLAPPGRPAKNGSKPDPISTPPTLAAAGIDKHLADRMKPSPAYAALTAARADGLRFAVLPNGTTVAVRAPRARLEYWAAILQSHKPALLVLLKAGA